MAEYIQINSDPQAKKVLDGFNLISITMKNSETGKVAWTSKDWGKDVFTKVEEAHLPKEMLGYPAVGREIVFSTVEPIKDFRIQQDVVVHGKTIEKWNFKFGFVIPNSENSWETIVQAAGEGNMLPAEYLSGNMYILTSFYAGNLFISRSVVKVFYE